MDNKTIVDSIKNLCNINNITVSQLEKNIGLSQGLVSKWSSTTPSLDKIIDIADYFKVSLDKVVGYHNVVNDKFLEKLIQQTQDKNIKWNKYEHIEEEQDIEQPKQYLKPISEYPFELLNNVDIFRQVTELSYFAKINNSYISIYGLYKNDNKNNNILNPLDLKLFVQPTIESKLIEQQYTYEQLIILWLKVLCVLNKNTPDEIKAEEFKNAFINETDMKQKCEMDNLKINEISVKTKELPDLQNIQEIISNPEIQKALQIMNKISKQLGNVKIADITNE